MFLFAIILVLGNNTAPLPQSIGKTWCVSLSYDGVTGNGNSQRPSISADGRFVVFHSSASDLVFGDSNGVSDIFIHDLQTGETKLVSVSSSGQQAKSDSWFSSVSAGGRFVAFSSFASNLVSGDTNKKEDIFVRDCLLGETIRVSVSSSGQQGNGVSSYPSISADGRFVAFHSEAFNLILNDTNGFADVFVHDVITNVTSRVSVSSSGKEANSNCHSPKISADGRFIAFQSDATNLVHGDTNWKWDVFVHDRETGQTTRVSVSSNGQQANGDSWSPSISADGRYVTFGSDASNLVEGDSNGKSDVFVHDRLTGETTRVSVSSSGQQGNGGSSLPAISADGRFVAFSSGASNLVRADTNGKWDVFVHDRFSGRTFLISVSDIGQQGNSDSGSSSISADGKYVVFRSSASNLIEGDTNNKVDVFVRKQ